MDKAKKSDFQIRQLKQTAKNSASNRDCLMGTISFAVPFMGRTEMDVVIGL